MKKTLKNFTLLLLMTILPLQTWAWSAKWIEASDCHDSINTWQIFKKDILIEKLQKQALAKIAVDSKYWLWINGKQVVFEGGLKRGPSPKDTYYDEVDIAPFLQKGNNTIALLTVYFGKEGFSHKSSGRAALLFEAMIGKTNVVSDETWQAAVYKAYGTKRGASPNWRLPESNICFDARLKINNWQCSNIGNTLKPAKVIFDKAINNTYGNLQKRPIPLFKDFGLKDYDHVSFNDTTRILTCRLPYNAQVTPYLKVKSNHSGDTIYISTDHSMVGREHCVTAAYITCEGLQEYESLGWMNGDYVYYTIPEGVEVESVKFRETGYDTESVSQFHCNDDFFNELWKRSVRTMYVNMRDTYFDCPDRERSQWWGDVCNDIQQSFYVFSPSAWALVDKGIYELMNWQRSDGTLFSPVPAGNWDKELPCQMLQSVGWYGFRHQAYYSDDYTFVPIVYDRIHHYLHDVWQLDENGFAIPREGGWSFADWGKNVDLPLITIEWYYLALKAEKEFALRLGKQADAEQITQLMTRMENNFNRCFWQDNNYRSAAYNNKAIDDRAQALAILCGFVPKENYPALLNAFKTSRNASPYFELYVQLALFKMGEGEFALQRARELFAKMLSYKDMTTLFEHWRPSASTNHGWSSGMTTILAQEVCGIKPTSPGFKTFDVCPELSGLTEVSTNVETKYGFIRVCIQKKENGLAISLTVPKGTKATIKHGDFTKIVGKGKHSFLLP